MRPADRERPAATVRPEQLHRFRLRRHLLAEGTGAADVGAAARAIGGSQAQLLSAARLSLATRTEGASVDDVAAALSPRGPLALAWCMRATLYLVPRDEVRLFAGPARARAERELHWLRGKGYSSRMLGRLLDALPGALETPGTQSEVAERVARALDVPVRRGRGGGWGSRRPVSAVRLGRYALPAGYLLAIASARAPVLRLPLAEGPVRYQRGDLWARAPTGGTVDEEDVELLRRYLRVFGPAAPEDFAWWTQYRRTSVDPIWQRLTPELASVDVGGRRLAILRGDLGALESGERSPSVVRLLPHFDTYVLGHPARAHLLPTRFAGAVYRPQGWISPTVLVDGEIRGVWEAARTGRTTRITVRAFRGLAPATRDGIREEASRVGARLGAPVTQLTFQPYAPVPRGRGRPAA